MTATPDTSRPQVQVQAIGKTADVKETDPDADNATVISLLRGILDALNTIATNTGS
jgi:hypothetical protein